MLSNTSNIFLFYFLQIAFKLMVTERKKYKYLVLSLISICNILFEIISHFKNI